jgi:hypothetical protein
MILYFMGLYIYNGNNNCIRYFWVMDQEEDWEHGDNVTF